MDTKNALIRPEVQEQDIIDVLSHFYDLKLLSAKKLNGYDDKNFHVFVEPQENCKIKIISRSGYVLKIINSFDSKNQQFFEGQDLILNHLGQNNVLCPQPVRTNQNKFSFFYEFRTGQHLVRLLEYIEGSLLCKVTPTLNIFFECGCFIGNCDRLLKDISHKGLENRDFIWRLDAVPDLKKYLHVINDTCKREICKKIISEFENRVVPLMKKLEKGLIHGDFNEQNILVDEIDGKIKAVLDFGDSHVNCYLFEVVLTITYVIIYAKDLDAGGYVLAGYELFRKLPQEELEVLKVCVCARLCQSLVLGAYSILNDPNNSYILTTTKSGWEILEKIWNTPENKLIKKWTSISENFKPNKI